MAESSNHLGEAPEVARAGELEAKMQLAVGERILTWVGEEKNKLQDSNTQVGKELKDVRAQLADSVKEK